MLHWYIEDKRIARLKRTIVVLACLRVLLVLLIIASAIFFIFGEEVPGGNLSASELFLIKLLAVFPLTVLLCLIYHLLSKQNEQVKEKLDGKLENMLRWINGSLP
ncbi:MAG: hypothetical protein WC519_00905 [Parcubacteria group bacterium]